MDGGVLLNVYADFYLQLSVFLARMVVLVLELFVVFLVMLVLLFAFLILTLPVSDGSRVRSVVLCEVDNGDIELIDLDRRLLRMTVSSASSLLHFSHSKVISVILTTCQSRFFLSSSRSFLSFLFSITSFSYLILSSLSSFSNFSTSILSLTTSF